MINTDQAKKSYFFLLSFLLGVRMGGGGFPWRKQERNKTLKAKEIPDTKLFLFQKKIFFCWSHLSNVESQSPSLIGEIRVCLAVREIKYFVAKSLSRLKYHCEWNFSPRKHTLHQTPRQHEYQVKNNNNNFGPGRTRQKTLEKKFELK